MRTLIIIIVVVVVVDDDTYYWVYLSSDHLFQVYYKVRQVLLQSVTILLQSATGITKCDDYYKVRQYNRSLTRSEQIRVTTAYMKQQHATCNSLLPT